MSERLSLCVIDMNDGHPNQAMRCFRKIAHGFFDRVQEKNPDVACDLVEVSPRNTTDRIPRGCDFYIGTGGPGSPYDGDGQRWHIDFSRFTDEVLKDCRRTDERQKSFFSVCYTFELLVRHFGVADVAMRPSRKFGLMPIYTTAEGRKHPLLADFADRLFAFEHRNWEAVDVDHRALGSLEGAVLALESRDGHSKGRAILGVDFGPGVEAVQFHPEADRAGVVSWVARPEQAAAFRETYGDHTYQAMLRTLDDRQRLARTFAYVIPGFLARRFNQLALARGLVPIDAPGERDIDAAFLGPSDKDEVASPKPAASSSSADGR